jgi:beta-glucosidase
MSRIDDLLAAMTLEEKLGQLTMVAAGSAVTGPIGGADAMGLIRSGRAGSLLNLVEPEDIRRAQAVAREDSRLGIPLLLGFDIVHGHRTTFPIPLAEASAFDPDLWRRTARAAAEEAAEDGLSLTFAPMLDVARDPRWGRIAEGPGEDPKLASRFAAAKVTGFQGAGLGDATALAATAKHFCAYGASTAGRDYASVDISERTLHEVYLPPFAAAVGAGVACIMPAFTDLAGVPMTASPSLLRGWLRDRQGFSGVVISDYNAIPELMRHGVAADLAEAAALALRAGVDIDMMGGAYERGLPVALDRGLVAISDVEAAVRRVLRLKEQLGLFERPLRASAPRQRAGADTEARRALAREAACRSIVLLTNRHGRLPLGPAGDRIAVIGPLADAGGQMLGPWAGAGSYDQAVSILDGLKAALPGHRLDHVRGVTLAGDALPEGGLADALAAARGADLVLLCVGERSDMSGEAASRADLDLPGAQRPLAEAVLSTGTPVVAVLSSGRPLTVSWLIERADACLATWFLGSEAGHAIADILTGRVPPTGRLAVTWPRAVGQIPIYFEQRPGGRPPNSDDRFTSKYLDMPVSPLFPFGHGLSYTQFRYSGIAADHHPNGIADRIEVKAELSNVGARAGEETVFLFARPAVAAVAAPALTLAGVEKIHLDPGAAGEVRFALPLLALGSAVPGEATMVPAGAVDLFVGPSADPETLLHTRVTLRPVDEPPSDERRRGDDE